MRLMLGETRNQVYATQASLEGVSQLIAQIAAQAEAAQGAAASARAIEHQQLLDVLRHMSNRGQQERERLRALRNSPAYERAYVDDEPLVSVVIPTYDNYGLLRDRAIPSVLSQTYQSFEIVVVGDAAPEEARAAIESFDDPRIRFFNRAYRGPYPANPEVRWLVAGVPPFNEAVRRSSGTWIAPLDDDDAFRPQHIERLLETARRDRLELAYGRLEAVLADGATETIGQFPPELGQFGLQSALYHAGLAEIFELELADAPLGIPYDWSLCLRMMEAGVRIGMVEGAEVDYFPSRSWTPRWTGDDYPGIGESAPEWEYVPEGWRRPTAGWDAEEVARAYREKWPQFLEAVEGPGPLGINHEVPAGVAMTRDDLIQQNMTLAFGYALARAAHGSSTVSMLDWGGALGHYYVLARKLMPEVTLEYHCRELPAVAAEGRDVLPEVKFHDSDECLDRTYDIVVASNSLQYQEDWEGLLSRLARAARKWLLVTRTPVARSQPSFVVLQRAHAYGYATEYLGWVFNRDQLLDAATNAGLELEREFELLGSWEIVGAPEAPSLEGFLFRGPEASDDA